MMNWEIGKSCLSSSLDFSPQAGKLQSLHFVLNFLLFLFSNLFLITLINSRGFNHQLYSIVYSSCIFPTAHFYLETKVKLNKLTTKLAFLSPLTSSAFSFTCYLSLPVSPCVLISIFEPPFLSHLGLEIWGHYLHSPILYSVLCQKSPRPPQAQWFTERTHGTQNVVILMVMVYCSEKYKLKSE